MLAEELMFRNEWGMMASYALPLDIGLRRLLTHEGKKRIGQALGRAA
jgi:hypothetical protein